MVRGRRASLLPRGISSEHARALLGSCDRRRPLGRRDYALIILLLRLGLRRGEVARLTLDDIDWRAGELVIHGKGGRDDRLPLPADVGAAIAAYLRRGRPRAIAARCSCAPVLRMRRSRPGRSPRPSAARAAARGSRKSVRIGCVTRPRARWSRPGYRSCRIGQVLRHSSLQSTAIYARVDIEQLRQLAAPWPGGERAMSELGDHAHHYLRARRALGVKLERHGRLLPQLVEYLEAAGASTVTRELAISWAQLPVGAHPQHWAARLSIARGFAAYLQTIDPATEVPPAGVFAVRYQRPTPYLWSDEDIGRLLDATGGLRPPLKAASYRGAVRAARRDRHARRGGDRAGAR